MRPVVPIEAWKGDGVRGARDSSTLGFRRLPGLNSFGRATRSEVRTIGLGSARPRVTIATMATETPMGAQMYQEQVARRASTGLQSVDDREWTVRRLVVRSLRSKLPGDRRIPVGRVSSASPAVRRALGRVLYGRDAVTHRMNLELPPAPGADVITIHDVVAWRFPDESPPVPAAIEEARRAAAVICVSEFSAREAVELLGITEPHVVHNGVEDRFFDADPLPSDIRRSFGIPDEYVLHAGGASRRKNLEALAEAWPLRASRTTRASVSCSPARRIDVALNSSTACRVSC